MKTKIIFFLAIIVLVVGGDWYYLSHKNKNKTTEDIKIKIGYLPVANALPLYLAIDKGYFSEVGLKVEPIKFESPNQIVDALIAGNIEFSSPSTGMGVTAVSQAKNPNTLKVFALNGGAGPNNIDNVFLIKKDSVISSVNDLKGKKVGIIPGIQWKILAQHIFDTEGLAVDKDVTIVELALPMQLQALAMRQIDALLTLEPTKVIGESQDAVRDLVVGPMMKYIADPWWGGGGVVSVEFAINNRETTKKVIAVFDRSIKEITADPDSSRQYLKNYTPLTEEQTKLVPLPIFKMYTDFQDSDMAALQKFFDIFAQYKVIDNKVDARQLIYSD